MGTKHFVTVCADGILQIGCVRNPIAYWVEHVLGIARQNGYTKQEGEEYAMYVDLAAKWMKHHGKEK
jgi:hypothetical protein